MFSVIIPMAGSGSRSKLNINKALWMLDGKPLFMHSVDKFKMLECEIVLVCQKDEISEIKKYTNAKVVVGGDTRAESVYNGLKAASYDKILVHDACRPFVSIDMIKKSLEALDNNKCAYVGIKCVDTIRNINGGVVDRNNLIMVQTPQALYKTDLIKAIEMARKDNIILTDDISYLEKYLNYKPTFIEGSRLNYKLTTPEDFKMAEQLGGII